jgi:hypothetical protein
LDTKLQKIDDMLKESFTLKGVKVVTGIMFASGQVDFIPYENYLDETLKSRYMFVIGLYRNGNITIILSISKDLYKFASLDEIKLFFTESENLKPFPVCSPSTMRGAADKFKKTAIEFLQSRDWEDSESQEKAEPA